MNCSHFSNILPSVSHFNPFTANIQAPHCTIYDVGSNIRCRRFLANAFVTIRDGSYSHCKRFLANIL